MLSFYHVAENLNLLWSVIAQGLIHAGHAEHIISHGYNRKLGLNSEFIYWREPPRELSKAQAADVELLNGAEIGEVIKSRIVVLRRHESTVGLDHFIVLNYPLKSSDPNPPRPVKLKSNHPCSPRALSVSLFNVLLFSTMPS